MNRSRRNRKAWHCLRRLWRICSTASTLAAATGVAAAETNPPGITVEVAFPLLHFDRPLYITAAPDGDNRLFVVEQAGRVLWFEPRHRVVDTHTAVDIRPTVRRRGEEEGLLGLAFHRQFKTNRQVFLHYTARQGRRRNVLSRFVMDEHHRIDPRSQQVILEVTQPWSNHNGGMIAFGPDGYLYLSLGDGGAAGDPMGNAQNRATLLGAILRIDVDRQDPSTAYAIPPDNPFVGEQNARGEIWAYGLRNVWRFSFDRTTGDLWAGDVGQNRREEINIITKGGNYGWNLWEGTHPFKPPDAQGPFEKPIVEHDRDEARSITGGVVYRGKLLPQLRGAYVYGDFMTGLVWALRHDGHRVTEHRWIAHVPAVTSFGEDHHGELVMTSLNGRLYKFVTKKQ